MRYPLAFLFFFILLSPSLWAQEAELKKQPKVGLVLSGGGAKGFAHIGVLKVIDSLNLKIDYVAGTSMGAIVGSLYASGYSGKQLDSIFRSVDFDDIINDNLPRSAKTFYERDNSERYAVTLPFEKFNLKLPSALSRGQNVFNLLSKLTLHVSSINEFEKLPIPFFCVATDVETGEAVILDQGNLPQCLTASGAFPSLFQPVIIGDRLLIDGGVTNNYPVDELRAKGMDIIIGVDVQDDLRTREEMQSAPDVLLQINNFRTINDMKSKSKKTDIYIQPDIKDFTVVSFSEGRAIIASGETEARKQEDALSQLPKNSMLRQLEETYLLEQDSLTISDVFVKGNDRYTRSYVLGKLKLKSDKKISFADFNRGVNNLIATNNFDTFKYDLKKSDTKSGYELMAEVEESDITTFLKLGLHYDDVHKSAALLNFTKKRLLLDNDILTLDLIVGDNPRYNFEYFIDKGFYWSIGLRSRFHQFEKGINAELILNEQEQTETGVNQLNAQLRDQTNQLYFQTAFRKDFALSIGGEHKRLQIKSETLFNTEEDEALIFENTDYLSLFGNLKLDTYSNKYYPKTGFFFNGDIHVYLYASHFNDDFDEFSIAKADAGYAFSLSDKLSVNLKSSGGFKLGDKSTTTLDFALGGYGNNFINNFVPFFGYDFISLLGNSYVKASFDVDYEIFKKNHIRLSGNFANADDDIFESGEWLTLPDYRGYALGYGLETFLGPIQVTYSYSPEDRNSVWYFNLGFWF